MNVHQFLLFCFFSALCGGNTGLVSAKPTIFAIAEGATDSMNCHVSLSGSRKFFCKDECKAEDLLIKTDNVTAESGRYSIKYRDHSPGKGIVSVTITNVTQSDSGLYRCGVGKTLVPDSYIDFEVRVSDASFLDRNSGFIRTYTEGEDIKVPCSNPGSTQWKFFCRGTCQKEEDILIETDRNSTQSGRYSIYMENSVIELHVTIRNATKSDTGSYRCGYGRASSSSSRFQIIVTDASVPSASTPPPPPTSTTTTTTTQSVRTTAGGFIPASVPPASTLPPPPPTTTTTTTQSVRTTAGGFIPWTVFPETIVHCTGWVLPLVVCVLVVVALLAVILLLLYKLKKNSNSGGRNKECVTYEKYPPAATCEDNIYQNLDPGSEDQNQTYSTMKE